MKPYRDCCAGIAALLTVVVPQCAWAEDLEKPKEAAQDQTRILQLQVFLDDAGFRPGVIDGHWGEFTRKALAGYLRAQGKEVPQFDEKEAPADLSLPMDSNRAPLTEYQITAEDEQSVGELPKGPEAQSKVKRLPYASVAEAVGEKFHAKVEFLKKLNPNAAWKAGETVQVPNVKSVFDMAAVEELKKSAKEKSKKKNAEKEGESLSVVVDTNEKMLDLMEGDRVVASVPITPGSEHLPAPEGEWKVERIVWLPPFRWDKQMLLHGKRSDDAFNLPPGPNSPVGIVWMQLNKEGIGLHGTGEPETIGRASSHGCIRLANWDALDIGRRLSPGVKVTIR